MVEIKVSCKDCSERKKESNHYICSMNGKKMIDEKVSISECPKLKGEK